MRGALPSKGVPDHVGLAYGAWAWIANDGTGKIADGDRASWLSALARRGISPDYARAFERWRSSFSAPGDRARELELRSRLLIGHGNPGPTDVGLTVHHTWGVPMIPGSALKGLLAHYVDAIYGPADPELPLWDQPETEREHARYQGVIWNGRRIQRGPSDVYRALFGAPDADEDREHRENGLAAGAQRGLVVFHDALYVPQRPEDDGPFAADVLTVHQRSYYNNQGRRAPNDYDTPNPVSFLSVRPRTRLLVALSGPPDWTVLASNLLLEALAAWGVGGKTSSGYGRLGPPAERATARGAPPGGVGVGRAHPGASPTSRGPTQTASERGHQPGDRITVTRVDAPKGKTRFVAADGIHGHFAGESPPSIEIGQTIDVWIANVGKDSYTLTLRDEIAAKLRPPAGGAKRGHGAPSAGPPKSRRR